MNTIEQIKRVGPVGAAQQLYRDGQGRESNPYTKGSNNADAFDYEMRSLQQREFIESLWGAA